MKMAPLDIVDGSYADEDKSFSAQDTVNYLPASAEQGGTRTPTILKTPPGLKPAVLIGVNEGEAGMQVAGPVRGTYNAEGRFFAVAGNTLFQITTGNVSVPLGTVPGVGRVSFSHNQITNGNEILVNNGNSGYIYNTVTQIFQRITDTGYPGGLRAVFINNRFVQIEPARRYVFNSDLADGLNYNALDRFTSETSPDLVMGIESIGNQLAVFSSTTTEWFEDTGANPQPFRSTGIVADKGAAGPFATAKMDNRLFFLADDGVFYLYQGYNPVRISTKPIEQAIRNKNWFNCFTTVWEESGYSVCYWTFPDGHTWGYDASSGKWHRRESYGFNRWRLNSLTYWRNAWYGGDFQAGKLYQLDWDYILEGDQEFESIRAAGVISDNQNRVIHERLELVINTGMVETVPIAFVDQPIGPTIEGNAPNWTPSDSNYSYQYTVTAGDAPIARVYISSGVLPSGMSMSISGEITGEPNDGQSGDYTFTVVVVDTNGLRDSLVDTINVSQSILWLFRAENPGATFYASSSPESWPVTLTRSPVVVTNTNGCWLINDGKVIVPSEETDAEIIGSIVPSGGVVTSAATTTPSDIVLIRNFGDISLAFRDFALSGSTSYFSKQTDDTWTEHTLTGPLAGRKIVDIGRMDSGRWVSYCATGIDSNQDAIYSDDDGVPTNWEIASGSNVSALSGRIVGVSSSGVIILRTLGRIMRSVDGENYSLVDSNHTLSGVRDVYSSGDRFIFVGQDVIDGKHISVTDDFGSTFTGYATTDQTAVNKIEDIGGKLCVSGSGPKPVYYCDTLLGNEWLESTLPFAPSFGEAVFVTLVSR